MKFNIPFKNITTPITAKKSDYRTGKYGSYKYLYISYWATSVQNKFLYIHCISSFFGLICMPFNEFDHL